MHTFIPMLPAFSFAYILLAVDSNIIVEGNGYEARQTSKTKIPRLVLVSCGRSTTVHNLLFRPHTLYC